MSVDATPSVLTDRDPGDETWDVREWRYEELKRAGYPEDVAAALATHDDVDLHVACGLLKKGATLEEALAILL